MGKLESESKIGKRKATIQKAILAALALGGVLAIGVIAPNALSMLGLFGVSKKKIYFSKLSESINGLVNKKYVEFVMKDGSRRLRITDKGKLYLYTLDTECKLRKVPKKWDKKWRVVIFDIIEVRRKVRDDIRRQLGRLGFLRLQDSVWVYPYDCEDIITLLKLDKQVGRGMLYMIVDQIELDKPIREHFGLLSK
ncbi:MAG TPA: hypothetical protein VJJ22_01530 [Candidatus Paceibacterota bacterium]